MVTRSDVTFLASQKKSKIIFIVTYGAADILGTLSDCGVPIKLLVRTKNEAENTALFQTLFDIIPEHVKHKYHILICKSVGYFPKDKFTGKFVTEWEAVFKHSNKIDYTQSTALIFSQKGISISFKEYLPNR